ncbi:MAG: type I glyceraldehyde-3-phosphate dehydrogenase [Candidatus Aminicenantes bacterium]
MTAKIAINGLGRIGRAALKIISETPELELAAINDLVPTGNLAYLLKYDTVYGRYGKEVSSRENALLINGRSHPVHKEKDPARLPWGDLDVDIVLECTGVFTKKDALQKHLQAGAKHVILSAPAKDGDVLTVVPGVNSPEKAPEILSCASCTTNCITPVVEVMGRRIGIKKAIMTTIHAYTSSQSIVDGPNKKMRRGRAGAANFVPTSTGAAKATTQVLTEFKNKFDGVAVRAPVPVGSISDIIFVTEKKTSAEEVNRIFKEEAESQRYKGILGASEEELVSSDIIQDPRASIVDLSMTQVVDGDLVKVMSWYDNEWGYSQQMIREAVRISRNL